MTTQDTTVTMRRCIGSTKFGIEAHEAPASDFPIQPSQKDGLGRMCKTDWNRYTNALRKAALARKAAEGRAPTEGAAAEPEPAKPARKSTRVRKPEPIKVAPSRRRKPADADHPAGSIADSTPIPDAEVAQEPAAR